MAKGNFLVEKTVDTIVIPEYWQNFNVRQNSDIFDIGRYFLPSPCMNNIEFEFQMRPKI